MKMFGMMVLAVAVVVGASSGSWARGGGNKGIELKAKLLVPVVGGARIGEAEYESRLKKGVTDRKSVV